MKTLRALMLASICALTTAGATSAPLLDVERTDTNVIVAGTPPTTSTATTEATSTTLVDAAAIPAGEAP